MNKLERLQPCATRWVTGEYQKMASTRVTEIFTNRLPPLPTIGDHGRTKNYAVTLILVVFKIVGGSVVLGDGRRQLVSDWSLTGL